MIKYVFTPYLPSQLFIYNILFYKLENKYIEKSKKSRVFGYERSTPKRKEHTHTHTHIDSLIKVRQVVCIIQLKCPGIGKYLTLSFPERNGKIQGGTNSVAKDVKSVFKELFST